MDTSQLSIGQRLKIARKSKRVTQEELGKHIGVGKSQISNIETGFNELTTPNAVVLSSALGIELNWLLAGEGEMTKGATPASNTNSGNQIKGSVSAIGNNSQAGSTDLQAEVERLRMETEHLKQRLKDKEDLIEILKLQGKNTQTKPSP